MIRTADTRSDPRWPRFMAKAREHGVLSQLCIPLWVDKRSLGTLSLYAGTRCARARRVPAGSRSSVKGGDIHGYGDAVFFTAVQLLTISSAITNPLTAGGKIVDVALEMWAIFVVTSIAGSFASFYLWRLQLGETAE